MRNARDLHAGMALVTVCAVALGLLYTWPELPREAWAYLLTVPWVVKCRTVAGMMGIAFCLALLMCRKGDG